MKKKQNKEKEMQVLFKTFLGIIVILFVACAFAFGYYYTIRAGLL